ncbi:MAG: DsbA family protein [Geminicoccaceae bacterium]
MPVELLYFTNPMCSWCWGFAPVIEHLTKRRGLPLQLATGQLGDAARPMRPQDKATVAEHWHHVTALTGQPFNHAFFDRERFVYDTGPACRALMTVRDASPSAAVDYLHRLQKAFYAGNEDIRDPAVLEREAVAVGMDGPAFTAAFDDPSAAARLEAEWRDTAAIGVTGYPTLLALAAGKVTALAVGCRPLADVEAALDPLLA